MARVGGRVRTVTRHKYKVSVKILSIKMTKYELQLCVVGASELLRLKASVRRADG